MEFKDAKEAIREIFKDYLNPFAVILEGTSAIYPTYKKRKELLKEKFYKEIFNGQMFIFKINNKFIYYSTVFGLSGVLDILGSILVSKKPKFIVLAGTCYLSKEIEKPSIVIPTYAETELLNFKGEASKELIKIAEGIIEKEGFDVVLPDNHLTKLSFLETFDNEKEKKALSVDMETSVVYYLANKYNTPAVSVLGISDYRTKEGKIKFVEYEYGLKDRMFEFGLEIIESLSK